MEKLKLVVEGVPPSTNRIWRCSPRGGCYSTREEREWFLQVGIAVKLDQFKLPESWKYYAVEIVIEPRRRQGDVDNRIKATLDALTRAGVWKDDSAVAFVSCEFGKVNKLGRTTITISERKEKYKEIE